jgi:hypothetical protein
VKFGWAEGDELGSNLLQVAVVQLSGLAGSRSSVGTSTPDGFIFYDWPMTLADQFLNTTVRAATA